MFNHSLLNERIKVVFGTKQEFAKYLGCSNVTLSNKLNNHTELSREEIVKWCQVLDIPFEQIPDYFFSLNE